jgi:ERCC4-type nuclease
MIIDGRESKLIEELALMEVMFETRGLDVGDIHLYIDDNLECIIERKTYADLYSSIQGNRYKEQKIRLQAANVPFVAYLIEGPKDLRNKYIKYDTIDSALLGTSFRDNFKIIYSDNINHTARLIIKLFNKLSEYKNSINEYTYLSHIKLSKKDNIDPETCFVIQLAQIPGISIGFAECIIKEFKTFYNLNHLCINDKVVAYERLKNIEVSTRVLGPKMAQKIIDYLSFGHCYEVKKIKLKL